MRLNYPVRIALLFAVALLTSCAGAPRTVDADATIKSVAVFSALTEDVPVTREAVLRLDKAEARLDMTGVVNSLAFQLLRDRLASSRPGWKVFNAPFDRVAFDKATTKGVLYNKPESNAEIAALAASARDMGADATIIISNCKDQYIEHPGISILLRTAGSNVNRAFVHSVACVRLLDRSGKFLHGWRSDRNRIAAVGVNELGIPYDVTNAMANDVVKASVKKVLASQLALALDEVLTVMGY